MKLIRPMIITGLLLSALPAFAQTTVTANVPEKESGKVCAAKVGFDSKLRLSPEQRAKLGTLHDQLTLSTADKKAELEVAHNQMRRLFEQPTIDKQAVLNLEAKINGLKDDLSTARVNMMLASADVLTPEQRAEFGKMHESRGWRHHRGHEGLRGQSERKVG